MKMRIAIPVFLFFSALIATPAHAETIYESNYSNYKKSYYSDITDIVNSDFITRVGGNFTYLHYTISEQLHGVSQKTSLNYVAAGGNIALYYCKYGSCIGLDQTVASLYTPSNSDGHFFGETHVSYLYRLPFANRVLFEFGLGIGLTYASNSSEPDKRVFVGNGVALSSKAYFNLTYFFTRDIGMGINVSPSVLYEFGIDNEPSSGSNDPPVFYGVDAGIHFMLKY